MSDYKKEFEIHGILSTENFLLTEDEISDAFLLWCESNGFVFSGYFGKTN